MVPAETGENLRKPDTVYFYSNVLCRAKIITYKSNVNAYMHVGICSSFPMYGKTLV